MDATVKREREKLEAIIGNLEYCIYGKSREIRLIVSALLAQGHVLLEDVPGTGKTVLVKALSKSINGQFRRIQCNPDLLPTDITGVSIFHPKDETFVFRPGPVMTNILLVDEINRATTKTQSAMLEAMEERMITVDGVTYPLPRPFLLLATQNPVDYEGTYTLPEAQLDRFMMKLSLGYPDREMELNMARSHSRQKPIESLEPVATIEDVIRMQHLVKETVHIEDVVLQYAVDLTRRTRESSDLFLGASPRATLALLDAARAYAFVSGRDYVLPDDIKTLAPYVLAHRMIMHSEARMNGKTAEHVLAKTMDQVRPPVTARR